jgi:hypothetical protein
LYRNIVALGGKTKRKESIENGERKNQIYKRKGVQGNVKELEGRI